MDDAEFTTVLQTVRSFVRREVVPCETSIEDDDAVPDNLRSAAAGLGLFGYTIPEEYGGLGCTLSQDVRLTFELGYTTPAFRSMFGTNNGIAGSILITAGSAEQRSRWLPGMARGDIVAAFALTEPDAGSDPSGMRTTARSEGDSYVLDGTKRFITNAPVADLFLVFARTSGRPGERAGVSVLAVPRDTPGLTVGPKDRKMGQAGAWTAEVNLDGARVRRDTLIGPEGEAYGAAMQALSRGRVHIAALCVGLGQRLVDESVACATQRRQSGTVIAEHQLVQAMLADSATDLAAGRALVLDAARAWDEGTDRRMLAACAKYFCSEAVFRIADRAVQVHGGSGYMRGVPVERFFRDARLFRIYEGTSQIQQLVIAGQLLRASGQRTAAPVNRR